MIAKDSKRGTWYAQVKVKDPITGEFHLIKKRGFAFKREAKEWEVDQLNAVKTVSTSYTFHQMADLWEDDLQVSKGTRQKHAEHYRKRFSEFYDKPLSYLTKEKLRQWRVNLGKDNKWSTATKNQTISYVKGPLRFAAEYYDLEDVTSVLKAFKATDAEIMSEMKVWTPEEFLTFQAAIPANLHIYSVFFETLFWSGARRGEIIALQKKDCKNGWIYIHQSWRTATEGFKPTKTKERRNVELDAKTWADLKAIADASPGPLVFGDGKTPLSPTTIKRVFDDAIEQSGVSCIRLHDLRHSHATWLINNGVNIVAVSKRLGHSSIEQTLKTYTHLLQHTDEQMMRIINKERESEEKK